MTRPNPWPFPTRDAPPPKACAPSPAEAAAAAAAAAPATPRLQARHVSEQALDEAVDETFPASDPISVVASKSVP